MSNRVQSILNGCLYFVRSQVTQPCLLCGGRVRGALLCAGCLDDLPRLPELRCPQCALPSPQGQICGRCLRHPPAFERTLAVYSYGFPVDVLVRQYKYQGALALGRFFAARLAEQVHDQPRGDVLLPMPLHPARLAERGFNQAAEMARQLSKTLGVPWQGDWCERTRDTPPQAGLDLAQRKRNLRGAFRCRTAVAGAHVILIDDVMTSGTSLDTLARAVLQAGARQVSSWVVARTL